MKLNWTLAQMVEFGESSNKETTHELPDGNVITVGSERAFALFVCQCSFRP